MQPAPQCSHAGAFHLLRCVEYALALCFPNSPHLTNLQTQRGRATKLVCNATVRTTTPSRRLVDPPLPSNSFNDPHPSSPLTHHKEPLLQASTKKTIEDEVVVDSAPTTLLRPDGTPDDSMRVKFEKMIREAQDSIVAAIEVPPPPCLPPPPSARVRDLHGTAP